MKCFRFLKCCAYVVCALVALAPVPAQDVRATILGRVTDPTGAAVPGANVEVLNLANSVRTARTTNNAGNYEIPFLDPGQYSLTIELTGFKKYQREGISLRVNDKITLDIALALGQATESVTVTGEVPLIEANTAALGQVSDHRRIVDLPLSGGNPMTLVRVTGGTAYTGAPNHPSLLAAVGAVTSFVIDGSPANTTEYNVDGTSVMTGRWPAFLPPEDIVDEFKVSTATYNASDGRSGGSAINVSLRSGTNQFHGTLYEYHSDVALYGIDMFQRQQLSNPATGPVTHAKERLVNPMFVINRPGGSIGGPLLLPRYNGRNRTFWMYAFEGFIRPTTEPGGIYRTVPALSERKGDFSALLALGSAYQIYDPATITPATGGRTTRQPFAGNIIPASRLDPAAQKLLSYWPEPSITGTADGLNNFVYPSRSRNQFVTNTVRVDEILSERQRLSAKVNYASQKYASGINLPTDANGSTNYRINYTGGFDHVVTLSPSMVLSTRYNFNRQTVEDQPLKQGVDLASLGFSSGLTKMVPAQYSTFPSLSVDVMTSLGGDVFDYSTTNYHVFGSELSWIHRSHSLHAGVDFRLFRAHSYLFGGLTPALSFGNTWTRGPLDNSPTAPVGQGLASFLLGLPTGGSMTVNPSSANQSWYLGQYLQDDWRVTTKLTLNLGVRFEHESPITERFDRSVGTFDFNAASPISAQAIAAYAANPIPQIPAGQFRVNGGVRFVGGGAPRGLFQVDTIKVSPRIGFAYTFVPKTVLRGGYGIYALPQGADVNSVRQAGYSRSTTLNASKDNGVTFLATLANPFPDGYLLPLGSAGGLSTNLGGSINAFNRKLPHAYTQRWSLTLQRELPKAVVLETSYVGSRTTRMSISQQMNALPGAYLSQLPVRDNNTINLLSSQVANPFYPLLPGTGLAATTVARSQLLLPYPQFTSVTMDQPIGFTWYHSLQARVERRFGDGFTIQGNYTWSKMMQATEFLNAFETAPTHVIAGNDRPQLFSMTGIYEFPFGPKRRFLPGVRGVAKHVIGGWQAQAIYQAQSGAPIGFGNVVFNGKLSDLVLAASDRVPGRWFNTDAGFDRSPANQLASNIRAFPPRLTGLRAAGMELWNVSVSKNFQIREGIRFQLRSEWLNATNHTFLAAPNTTPTSTLFGTVTANTGYPRQIYFVGKLYF